MNAMAPAQGYDPGLTNQFAGQLRRAINKDGSFNVRRRGATWTSWNPYLFLVDTTWLRFMGVVLGVFLLVNLLFATAFYWIGLQHLAGSRQTSGVGPFASAFFFSVHTLTTVGYGNAYPTGFAANILAATEAAVGLMGFALATGLLFARFSRPSAKIVFSNHLLITKYGDITSLQFRIANQRNSNLLEVEARMLLMTVEMIGGELRRQYIDLPLERPRILFFPLTWTVVHPIDNSSPLYGKTGEDLRRMQAEVLILVKGFDDTFSQMVNVRYSYRHDEVVWGSRFLPAFTIDSRGDLVLELGRVHDQGPR